MHIVMRAMRVLQDAGRERPLNVGEVYDLPDIIALAFIATGVAERHDARETADLAGAPERKTRRGARP